MLKKGGPSTEIVAVPLELIERRICLIRGHRVIEAVKRNARRFPEHFMFQLSGVETAAEGPCGEPCLCRLSRCDDVTANEALNLRSQFATSNEGRGGRRTMLCAFMEHGVAMLSPE